MTMTMSAPAPAAIQAEPDKAAEEQPWLLGAVSVLGNSDVPGGRSSGLFTRPDGTYAPCFAEVLVLAPDGVTVEVVLAGAKQERAILEAMLARVAGEFENSDEAVRVRRVRADLEAATAEAARAKSGPDRALAASKRAILDGRDPATHEQEFVDATARLAVLANRVQAHEEVLAQSLTSARSALSERLHAARREQRALAAFELAGVEQAIRDAVGPHLSRIIQLRERVALTAETRDVRRASAHDAIDRLVHHYGGAKRGD